MAVVGKTTYRPVPFCLNRLASYVVFPSKNWHTESSPSLASPPPLGFFNSLSPEVLFRLFDFVDLASLGKLSNTSKLMEDSVSSYFDTKGGRRRLDVKSLHFRDIRGSSLNHVHKLAVYLKRKTCLIPTRGRLPILMNVGASLDCFTAQTVACTRDSCDGLVLLGEMFHTFVAGWEESEADYAFNFFSKHCMMKTRVDILSSKAPGEFPFLEMKLRKFVKQVLLRNGKLEMRELAIWITRILHGRTVKIKAFLLYVLFGPLDSSRFGFPTIRWSDMGEMTPPSSEAAREWFSPLADALRSLYMASSLWSHREVLTLMHEVTILHGDTWLLENAACLLLSCGGEMIETLLLSRIQSKKVEDIGAWIAALSVAVVHMDVDYSATYVIPILREVLSALGTEIEIQDALFDSISNTFIEFINEYAELMCEDEERHQDLNKILRGQAKFQQCVLREFSSHLPLRRSIRVRTRVSKTLLREE